MLLRRFVRNKEHPLYYCNVLFLYLYFLLLSLSLRNTSKALELFKDQKRSHYVAAWDWIQRFGSSHHIYNIHREFLHSFIEDETIIQIGSQQHLWLWICIEPVQKSILGIYIHFSQKREKNMFVAENFIRSLVSRWKT